MRGPGSSRLLVDSLYAEPLQGSRVEFRENAPVNGLDLHIAHVLSRLPVSPDAAEMRIEPVVPRPRRISIYDHVFLFFQVYALVTLWTEKDLRTHGDVSMASPSTNCSIRHASTRPNGLGLTEAEGETAQFAGRGGPPAP